MARGRKPKPTSQHERRGTFRHDRHGGRAAAKPEIPDPPEMLSAVAADEWKRITGLLAAAGMIAQVDRAALALYCQAWADYWSARREVEDNGWTTSGSTGNVVSHPSVGAMQKAWTQCLQAAREFGMTPSARASIKIEKPESQDATEKALFGVVG